jgi:hypothetical protein
MRDVLGRVAVALVCGSLACDGRAAGSGQPADASVVDAGSGNADADTSTADGGSPACTPTECRASSRYRDLGVVEGIALQECDVMPIDWGTSIADECGEDLVRLSVVVYERGIFKHGVEPGTYELSGDQLGRDSCAACVALVADAETDTPTCYFATGGTFAVESMNQDEFVGSLADVTFGPVSCDTFARLDTGCGSAVDAVSIDAPVVHFCP